MKRKSETVLKQIAKALYFTNPLVKEVFADEFGRFSYTKDNLLQINDRKGVKVVRITREMVSKTSVEGTVNFSKDPGKFPGANEKPNESKEATQELKNAEKMQKAFDAKIKKLEADAIKTIESKQKEFKDQLIAKQKELDEVLKKGAEGPTK